MLTHQWQKECQELAADKDTGPNEISAVVDEPFNLLTPRSRCPACGHTITALENIPVLSYLWLRGRCKACHAPIPVRYPLIEIAGAVVAMIAGLRFGLSWETVAAALLGWALLAAAVIDLQTQLLPDLITLPLLWLGLLFNLNGLLTPLHDAVVGAIAGYVSLWLIYHLFRLITGKEGMGYGDFKLLAALGAWFGWQLLPLTVLLSSFVGAVIGIGLMMFKRHQREVPIPFGPYLAAAGWFALLWGHTLSNLYLRFAHIS